MLHPGVQVHGHLHDLARLDAQAVRLVQREYLRPAQAAHVRRAAQDPECVLGGAQVFLGGLPVDQRQLSGLSTRTISANGRVGSGKW